MTTQGRPFAPANASAAAGRCQAAHEASALANMISFMFSWFPVRPTAPLDTAFDPELPPEPPRPAERWWGNHIGELRWQLELYRLLADPVFRGAGVPRGDGAPVVLIPGFLAGDASLSVMRGWLRRLGYDAHGSGMRANVDCSDRAVDALELRIDTPAAQSARRAAPIG